MSDEEDEEEDVEDTPDLPTILYILDSTMKELNERTEWETIKKIELAKYINVMLDAMVDISRWMSVLQYRSDTLEKAVNRLFTAGALTNDLKDVMEEMKKPPKKSKVDQPMYL